MNMFNVLSVNVLPALLALSLGFMLAAPAFAEDKTRPEQAVSEEEISKAQHYTNAVDGYIRGLNEKDLEGILSLYADNATVEDPVGGGRIVAGEAAVRAFYSGAVKIDLNLTRTGPVRVAGSEAAFPFQLRMEENGILMKTDIIDVFRFNEAGKIVSMRAFWGPTNRKPAQE